jgi:hypothetical protein
MDNAITRFVFDRRVRMREVERTLQLARVAAEGVHGTERVDLDACCALDRASRTVWIDAVSNTGHTLALVFLRYCRAEFGADAVSVERPASHEFVEGAHMR